MCARQPGQQVRIRFRHLIDVFNLNCGQFIRHFWCQAVIAGHGFHDVAERHIIPAARFMALHVAGLFFRIERRGGSVDSEFPRWAAAAAPAHNKPALINQVTVEPKRHPQARALFGERQCWGQ